MYVLLHHLVKIFLQKNTDPIKILGQWFFHHLVNWHIDVPHSYTKNHIMIKCMQLKQWITRKYMLIFHRHSPWTNNCLWVLRFLYNAPIPTKFHLLCLIIQKLSCCQTNTCRTDSTKTYHLALLRRWKKMSSSVIRSWDPMHVVIYVSLGLKPYAFAKWNKNVAKICTNL